MLEEASPRRFEDHEVDTSAQDIRLMSSVKLVNQAWQQFYRGAMGYSNWENNTISIWLGTD
jgi:Rps23 Pro-64 3,4-dihydroxylase Tpa1-like proline 4-hydroxylase